MFRFVKSAQVNYVIIWRLKLKQAISCVQYIVLNKLLQNCAFSKSFRSKQSRQTTSSFPEMEDAVASQTGVVKGTVTSNESPRTHRAGLGIPRDVHSRVLAYLGHGEELKRFPFCRLIPSKSCAVYLLGPWH